MEFLSNIRWYHVAIIGLIVVIVILIVMDSGCSKLTCQNAVKPTELFNGSSSTPEPSQTQNKLVLYHASFCGYCKQIMPTWEKFTHTAKTMFPNLTVVKYQCDGSDKDICEKNDIQGYPTIQLYLGDKVIPFNGERTVDGIVNFVKSKLN